MLLRRNDAELAHEIRGLDHLQLAEHFSGPQELECHHQFLVARDETSVLLPLEQLVNDFLIGLFGLLKSKLVLEVLQIVLGLLFF